MAQSAARRQHVRWAPLVSGVVGCAWLSSATIEASAQPWPTQSPIHLAVGFGTDFPASIGVRADVELPLRLRLSSSLGILPGAYVDTINGFLVGVNAYGQNTADLIRAALSSSMIWRSHVGWRPFRKHGLYLDAGYGLITLGGGATAAELIAGLTDQPVPEGIDLPDKPLSIESTLHMIDVEIGWQWLLVAHLQLRVGIGAALTIAASSRISAEYPPISRALVDRFTAYGEAYLDDIYRSYVFTPVGSVSLSWALF